MLVDSIVALVPITVVDCFVISSKILRSNRYGEP